MVGGENHVSLMNVVELHCMVTGTNEQTGRRTIPGVKTRRKEGDEETTNVNARDTAR